MLIQPINGQPQAIPVQSGSDVARAAATPSTVAAQGTTPTQQPTPAQLKEAVKVINQAFEHANQSLAFTIDSATKQTIVKLTDTSTGEVIRQFPTQQTLAISQSIEQYQHGMLLTQKA